MKLAILPYGNYAAAMNAKHRNAHALSTIMGMVTGALIFSVVKPVFEDRHKPFEFPPMQIRFSDFLKAADRGLIKAVHIQGRNILIYTDGSAGRYKTYAPPPQFGNVYALIEGKIPYISAGPVPKNNGFR